MNHPSKTADQDSEVLSAPEILILREAYASQVSAGDGVVVKGLKQNLKHFMSAQKAFEKRTGFGPGSLIIS